MRLVKELKKDITPINIIITGDGTGDYRILKPLCERFNGLEKVIWFPATTLKRKTGLTALNSIKTISNKISSIIFIIDGEFFENNAENEITDKLNSIGMNIIDILKVQDAFIIQCKIGNREIILYCVIMGPETFIEEEIVKLIELELRIEIDLQGDRNRSWKDKIKRKIKETLKNKHMTIKQLIENANTSNLKRSFPNICEILMIIEET